PPEVVRVSGETVLRQSGRRFQFIGVERGSPLSRGLGRSPGHSVWLRLCRAKLICGSSLSSAAICGSPGSELLDELDQRQEEGDDDEADGATHADDQDGLD